jgi:hypothetical protein
LLLGGLGRDIGGGIGFLQDKWEGVDTPTHRIPFVRRFVGTAMDDPFRENEKFYESLRTVTENAARLKRAFRAEGEPGQRGADARKLVDELGDKYGLYIGPRGGPRVEAEEIFSSTQRYIRDLRKDEIEVRNNPALSRAERAEKIKAIRQKMADEQKKTRRDFRDALPEAARSQ